MIHVRNEGEKIKQGFNFYPLSNPSSFGFILRIGYLDLSIRYSKILNYWAFAKVNHRKIHDK